MKEEWRPIVGYEGRYSISNLGRVRSELTYRSTYPGRILKLGFTDDGYPKTTLSKGKRNKHTWRVHQLVAMTFIGPYPLGKQVNHKDGNKTNNIPTNLEYVTGQENKLHNSRILGTGCGERINTCKLTRDSVIRIRHLWSSGVWTTLELAAEFKISRSQVYNIIRGTSWRCC